MKSLFEDFKGWQIGVITAHKEFQENVGRYATTLKSIKSGNLDTTFYLYNGTEKEKKRGVRPADFNSNRKKSGEWKKDSPKKQNKKSFAPRERKNENSDKEYF